MKLPQLNIPFAFDDLVDGYWDLDLKNDRVYLSQTASKLFGHERPVTLECKEVINSSIHEDYKNSLKNEFGQLFRNGIDILDTQIKVKSSNGWKWVHLKGKALSRDKEGSPKRLWGTVIDISEYKKAEQDLQRERKMLRSIIDNLPVTIYVMDKKGRKILSNKADCRIIGANEEFEVLGKTDLELFPGETGERGHNDNMSVINTLIPIVNREEVFYDKTGNQKWLLTSKIPHFSDDNQIVGIIGIGIDITEQKNLQQKISESDNFYRTLVNLSPNGVVVTDLHGNATFFSERAHQIFKIPEGDNQVGESVFKWVAPDSLARAKTNFMEALDANRAPKSEEYKCLNYDKSEFWAEMSSSLLLDFAGNRIGLMIVSRDITDRKKIEADLVSAKNKAEENDKLKTAFLHNISHEIRTPLNAIVGFSSLLDELSLSKHQKKSYIEIIHKSSDHLLEIISDILEISNIEAGIVKVNENELNLNELIEDLFNRFNLDSERRNIRLKASFGILNEKAVIHSDRTKLVQVLSNLLSNSLKFTDAGIIKFGYSVNKSNIKFYVKDTGKGIPQDEFHKIFNRFYQVEHSEYRLNEGTGLGLSICKAYVELLGGRIWLTSKVGEGTTFFFTIPYKVKISLKGNERIYTEYQSAFASDKTILIAEDDDNNYRLLCEFLKSLGHKTIRAKDGVEAIEIIKSVPGIDLVVMDIKMPVLNGFEATKKIKEILPDLPVIAITAYSSESGKKSASDIGFADFISKPFSLKELNDSLNRVLKKA